MSSKKKQGGKKSEPIVISRSKAFTLADMLQESVEAGKKAHEIHMANGGMCQLCEKNPAEYPDGLSPYNCKECNAETQKLVDELEKDNPGFHHFRF